MEKFDGYEITQVVCYRDYCEPISNPVDIEVAQAAEDFEGTCWTLYGHMPEGGVMSIGDFKTEAAAEEVLARIGGTRNH